MSTEKKGGIIPRNVWIVGLTSFFTDISSEMIANLLPLYLKNVLGVKTVVIGLIEGVAESTASILKIFSGWISDRLHARKWLAVIGYGISALSKVAYLFASSWGIVAGARWGDRVGKGVRTAPRDALIADSVEPSRRGFAFGFHRAADTAGAFLGLALTLLIVIKIQGNNTSLQLRTFHFLVIVALIPAIVAVLLLALKARDVTPKNSENRPRFAWKSLGKPFFIFITLTALFELGNSSDAFLVLRAQERGLSLPGIIGMLLAFNFVYTLVSTPAGKLSDRLGRRTVIAWGWGFYALIYLGMGLARNATHIVFMYVLYGFYYGLASGTSKAFVADLVAPEVRGVAFGTYNAVIGVIDLPASILAGVLWNGIGSWKGFGPSAPFLFGSCTAVTATILFLSFRPGTVKKTG